MEMLGGGSEVSDQCRKPEIMADAAYVMLTQDVNYTGNFAIDDEVLMKAGITDMDQYACSPGNIHDITTSGYLQNKLYPLTVMISAFMVCLYVT